MINWLDSFVPFAHCVELVSLYSTYTAYCIAKNNNMLYIDRPTKHALRLTKLTSLSSEWKLKWLKPLSPRPLCASYLIQTMVHTWRGRGCFTFIEINVKRQSNPPPLKVCSIQRCTAHIQPSKIISKSVHRFGTTAGVILGFK